MDSYGDGSGLPLLGNGRVDGDDKRAVAAAAGADGDGNGGAKRRSTLLTVCPFILGNEFCERLAYYGLATNFVTYLTHVMGTDAATAAVEVMVFEGTCYVTPLLGAYLADSHWGRYRTILIFSGVYLVGMVALALTSWLPGLTPGPYDEATPLQNGLLYAALGVIALGTGGIKPNVSAFGADQFDETDPGDRREKERFFNWFYLSINVGSLIACTAIVYVQDQVSWSLGFSLPAAAMATAVGLFLAGGSRYRHVAPTESPMARVVKVVAAALRNRWRGWRAARRGGANGAAAAAADDERGALVVGAAAAAGYDPDGSLHRAAAAYRRGAAPFGDDDSAVVGSSATDALAPGRPPLPSPSPNGGGSGGRGPAARSSSFRWLEDAITEWQQTGRGGGGVGGMPSRLGASTGAAAAGAGGAIVISSKGSGGATNAALGYSPAQVEEVKMVLRLLPVFFTTALYWTIYAMMGTMFIQQGALMDNAVGLPGGLTLRVPAATMALFNTGAIIALVPLYDAWFEPALRRAGLRWTLLRRIGWGMVIAVLAMFYAAGVEMWRLSIFRAGDADADGGGSGGDNSAMAGAAAAAAAAGLGHHGGGGGGPYPGPPQVVPLSILWQAPAYVLIGLSEVFASIAQLEFFYDQAPDVMRSCSMALQLLSTAVGSYLGGGLVAAVAALSTAAGGPWLPKDLNRGHLDWFLWLCGAMMAANTALFALVASGYEYKTVEHVARLVQVPDDEEAADELGGEYDALRRARRPPRPPAGPPSRRAPVPIAAPGGGRRTHFHYAAAASGRGGEGGEGGEGGDDDDEGALYSRSLAYVPSSPALPAPFR